MNQVGSMKRVFSGIEIKKNLKRASQKAVMYPLRGIEVVGDASSILKQSRGRDKICSLLQYIADFYYSCHKHSQIGLIKLLFLEGQIKSVIIAGKVRDSMKQGRKIFKFLKYLEQLDKFKKIYKNQGKQHIFFSLLQYLKVICKICSQFFDNILWGINVGVLSEVVTSDTPKNVKNIKDTFSLIGQILKIIVTHIQYLENDTKEQTLFEEILKIDNCIMVKMEKSRQLCLKYLVQRGKKRDKRYKLVITLIRIMMLTKRLKIYPLNKLMDGVLYSFCGLFITVTEIFIQLTQQPLQAKVGINQLQIAPYNGISYIQSQSLQSLDTQGQQQFTLQNQNLNENQIGQSFSYINNLQQKNMDLNNGNYYKRNDQNFIYQNMQNQSLGGSDFSDLINRHVDQQFDMENSKNKSKFKKASNQYDVGRGLTSSSDSDDEQQNNQKNNLKNGLDKNKHKIIQNSEIISQMGNNNLNNNNSSNSNNRRYSSHIHENKNQIDLTQQKQEQQQQNFQRTMSCKDHIFAMADNYNQTIQNLAKSIKINQLNDKKKE
ncbi:hypothetical protein PPERSA_10794 [Pseudocohnilembus persalinus]|uniref:Uncharacterized protein n=1 Tax=Pseudocohnilembus persalinus TaxID=266149 RepID=A0A0V0QDL4_PSEPJ|nr:hypothetical protein PPERSA_10794 [Pseudocohnilembus persalinus]|eukprot:KRX00295.1 hypothetical protein PPERSA_10794 [Pseudocohnilembus persalinus]